MNTQSAIKKGATILKNSSIKTAVLDTEILMAKVLGSKAGLLNKEVALYPSSKYLYRYANLKKRISK